MRILLIDGDEIAWRTACTARRAADVEPDLVRRLDRIASALRGDRLVLALSHRDNWRKTLWPGYKAHRTRRVRPPLLATAYEALRQGWETRVSPALEADDVLGLCATDPGFLDRVQRADGLVGAPSTAATVEPAGVAALRAERAAAEERVVVSSDKDLLTVPGLHGCSARDGGRIRRISEDEADLAHLRLTLAGDRADGFLGCPSVGPVKAARLLNDAGPDRADRWRAVRAAFAQAGLSEQTALLQARLARVLRAGELDGDGRPVFWSP